MRGFVGLAAVTALLAVAPSAFAQTGGVPGGTSPTPSPAPTPSPSVQTPAAGEGSWTVTKKATWYGPGFWGQPTACGIVLAPSTIGVAHKTLPCGTQVTFTFNGVSIAATVIDRGPYNKGYAWDLTKKTAKKVGFLAVGAGPIQAAVTPPAA